MAEPTVQFGVLQTDFGDLTASGWYEQSANDTTESQREVSTDRFGNPIGSKLYNEGRTVSKSYESNVGGAAPTIPEYIGGFMGQLICTGIHIQMNGTSKVTMNLDGHNHTVNAHVTDTLRKCAHGFTLSKSFGAQCFIGSTAGANAAIQSSTLDITCEHEDKEDGDGNHFKGENYGAKASATTVWTGEPTVQSSGAEWDKVSVEQGESSTGHKIWTVKAEKKLTMTSPA